MLVLKPGARLKSAVCDTEVMVVKGSGEVDLRCGGASMVNATEQGEGQLNADFSAGSLVGKRYTTEDAAIELLCTKAGEGSLSLGEAPLGIKQAQTLPSSD
ncbi:hypothetical protein HBA55_00380 [Pseudomaricurvus alkylphenolicus]|uniref:hypothetical protein n=1 Tax=Pseudomaricurvus alkylphenolicus TaxID=1306991 RepID=UPI0014213F1D|nr:hypothetical protein [Pseudomaricurvus alkylphenolicus]NIB38015.1 hypothetical protein [Pseudomaricurvus alkylphenolicus]